MKRFVSAVGWLGVGLAVFGLCLRAADVRGAAPLVQGAWPAFALGAVLLALLAAPTRRPWFTLVTATLAVTYVAVLLPGAIPRTVAARDSDLVVLTADLDQGNADVAAVARVAQERDADIVVLLEVTPAAKAQVDAAFPTDFAFQAGRARPDAGGAMILSREELQVVSLDQNDIGFDQPTVELRHAGTEITLRAVHAQPPRPAGSREWRNALWWLEEWRQQQPAGRPLVMAGDLNATSAHPAFRDLAAGMTDAQARAGRGWDATWPADGLLPVARLDHVLVRDLQVADAGTAQIGEGDHRAVWARLRVG